MRRRAVVIGLGQIGMGYDLEADPKAHVLTHARAFREHHAYELCGGVDSDSERRGLFEERYGAPAFSAVADCVRATQPEVVAIAVPTALHAQLVRQVLECASPVALLCEKPLAFDLDEARDIVARCNAQGSHLYVNYMRRSEPGSCEVKRRVAAGAIATPVKGIAWYSKGLLNNGSHFLNLLEDWLGAVRDIQVLAPGRRWAGVDPEPDFKVSLAAGEVYFLAAREEDFSHYGVELVTSTGRLRYERGGEQILWQPAATDPVYPGYRTLSAAAESIDTDFAHAQWHVADQLAASLDGEAARICSGAEALRTIESLAAIRANL